MHLKTRKWVAAVMVNVLITTHVIWAENIIVDSGVHSGTNRPVIDETVNGVPIINVTKPSDAGISSNSFKEYGVGEEGLILNNGLGNSTTLIGGTIYGNPNYTSQTAEVILIDVTGAKKTNLRGFTEIAGDSADLILANPNGLYINGAGFINTNRATLSTGKTTLNGSLIKHGITDGLLEIGENGLWSLNTGYVDLLAKTVKINGYVVGTQNSVLSIIAGSNTVSQGSLETLSTSVVRAETAIDTSALGGMYHGKIRLISTDKGAGVHAAGDIVTYSDDLELRSNGDLAYNTLYSGRDIRIKSQGNITQSGQSIANGGLAMEGVGDILLKGKGLYATRGIGVRTSSNIVMDGHLATQNAFIQTDNLALYAGGGVTLNTAFINTQEKIGVETGKLVVANSQLITAGEIQITSNRFINTQGSVVFGHNVTINADKFYNIRGIIQSANDSTIRIGKEMLNDSLAMILAKNVSIESPLLINKGQWIADNGVTIKAETVSWGPGSLVYANTVSLNATLLESNSAYLYVEKKAQLDSKGVIAEDSVWTLDHLIAKGDTWIFENQGISLANDADIQVKDVTLDHTTLQIGGSVAWASDAVADIKSVVSIGSTLNAQIGAMRHIESNWAIGGKSIFEIGMWEHYGNAFSLENAVISANTWVTEGASIYVNKRVDINTDLWNTTQTKFETDQDLYVTGRGLFQNETELNVKGSMVFNLSHWIASTTTLNVGHAAIHSDDVYVVKSNIAVQGNANLNLGTGAIDRSVLNLLGDNTLNVTNVTVNASSLAWGNKADIQGGHLNIADSYLQFLATSNAQFNVGDLNTSASTLNIRGDATFLGREWINNKSLVMSGGTLNIAMDSIQNSGAISAYGINVDSDRLKNNGYLKSDTNMYLKGTHIENETDGKMSAKRYAITSPVFKNDGTIDAKDSVVFTGFMEDFLNLKNGVFVLDNQSLNINAKNIRNEGLIQTNQDAIVMTGYNLENTGIIAGSVQNTQAERSQIIMRDVINNSGAITSESGLYLEGFLIQNRVPSASIGSNAALETIGNVQNEGAIYSKHSTVTLHGGDAFLNTQTGQLGGKRVQIDMKETRNDGVILHKDSEGVLTISGQVFKQTDTGFIKSLGGLSINTNELWHGGISDVSNNVSIGSLSIMRNAGQIRAGEKITMFTDADVTNEGVLKGNAIDLHVKTMNSAANSIIQAEGGVTLSATSITNAGIITANADIQLFGAMTNLGLVASGGQLRITGSDMTNSGVLFGKDQVKALIDRKINNSGSLSSDHLLDLSGQTLTNTGTLQSGGSGMFQGKMINSGLVQMIGDAVITGEALTNFGTISVVKAMTITANTITNQSGGAITGGAQMTLNGNLMNAGVIDTNEAMILKGDYTASAGAGLFAGKALLIEAKTVSNNGNIEGQTISLSATKITHNTHGILRSEQDVTLTASNILSNGQIRTSGNSVITGEFEQGSTGVMIADKAVTITGNTIKHAGATLALQGNITIRASQFANTGIVNAGTDVEIYNPDSVVNQGLIRAEHTITVYSPKEFLNQHSGQIIAKDALFVSNGNTLNNTGILVADNAFTALLTGSFTNDGTVFGDTVSVNASTFWNKSNGKMTANTTFESNAPLINNGLINSFGLITLTGSTLDNTGEIESKGNLDIIGEKTSNSGRIFSEKEMRVHLKDVLTNSGKINSNGYVNVYGSVANAGAIEGANNLKIQGGSVTNSGRIVSNLETILDLSGILTNSGELYGDAVTLRASSVNNATTGKISASRIVDIYAPLTNAGLVNSKGALNVFANSTNSGTIQSEKLVYVSAQSLTNQDTGKIISNEGINISAALTNSGAILAEKTFDLTGPLTNNQNGSITAKTGFNINASSSDVMNSGVLYMQGIATLSIQAKSLTNSGTIVSSRDISLRNATTLTNSGGIKATCLVDIQGSLTNSGGIESGADMALYGTGAQLINSGQISTSGNLDVRFDSVTNTASGLMQSQGNSVYQASLTNDGKLYAVKDLEVRGAYLRNTNDIKAGQNMTVVVDNALENTQAGLVRALANLNVTAKEVVNEGQLQGTGHPTLESNTMIKADKITNKGVIAADSTITVEGQTLENSGILDAGNVVAHLDNTLTNTGDIAAAHNITITGGPNLSVVNRGGTVLAQEGSVYISAKNLTNTIDAEASVQAKIGTVVDIWSGYQWFSYVTKQVGGWDIYLQTNPWTKQGLIGAGLGVNIATQKTENIGSTIKGVYVDIQTTDFTNKGYGNEINYVNQSGYTKEFKLNLAGNVVNGMTLYQGRDRYQFGLTSLLPGISDLARHNANALVTGDYVRIQATSVINGDSKDMAQVAEGYGYGVNTGIPSTGTGMKSSIQGNTVEISATTFTNNGFIKDVGKGTEITATILKNNGAITGSNINIETENLVENNGVVGGARVYINTNGDLVNNQQIRGSELSLYTKGSVQNNKVISANSTTLKSELDFNNLGEFKTNNLNAEVGRNFYNDDYAHITGQGDHYWDIKGTTTLFGGYEAGSLTIIGTDKVTSGFNTYVRAKNDIHIKSKKSVKLDGNWYAEDQVIVNSETNIGVNGLFGAGNYVGLSAQGYMQNSGTISAMDIAILTQTGSLYNNSKIIGNRYVGIIAKGGLCNGYDSIQTNLVEPLVDLDSTQKGQIQGQDVSIETYSSSGDLWNRLGSVIKGTNTVSITARMASIWSWGAITGKNKVKIQMIDSQESIRNFGEISTSGNYQLLGNYIGYSGSKLRGTSGVISGQSFYSSGTIDTKYLVFEGQNTIRDFGTTHFDVLKLDAPNATLTQGGTWDGGTVVGAIGNGIFTQASTTKVDTMGLRTSGNIQTNGQLTAGLLKITASGNYTNTGVTTTQVSLINATKGITNTNKLIASEYAQFKSTEGGFDNAGIFEAANVSFNFHNAINRASLMGLSDPKFAKMTEQQLKTLGELSGGTVTIQGVQYRVTNANGIFGLDEVNSFTTQLLSKAPSLFRANIVLAETTAKINRMKTLGNKEFTQELLNGLTQDRRAVLLAVLKGEGNLSLAIGGHKFTKTEKELLLDLLEGRRNIENVNFVNIGEKGLFHVAPTFGLSDRDWLLKFLDESIALLNGPASLRITDTGQTSNGAIGSIGLTQTDAGIQFNAADFGLGDLGKIVTFGNDGRLYLDGVGLGQVHISESAQFASDETLRASELLDSWFLPDTAVGLKSKQDVELDRAMQVDALLAKAGRDINVANVGITANRYISLDADNNVNMENGSALKGGGLSVKAGVDLNAIGAKLKGLEGVELSAGNDINLIATINETKESSSEKNGKTRTTTTTVDQEAEKVEIESAGTVVINAGNNATLVGVDVTASGNVLVDAGQDVEIHGIEETDTETIEKKKKGGFLGTTKTTTHTETEVTVEETEINAIGRISIKAGNAITAEGVELLSGQKTQIVAAGDVTITGMMESKTIEDKMKKKSLLKGKEKIDISYDETVDQAGIRAAGGLEIQSTSGNVAIIGTVLQTAEGEDIEISASKNIVIGNMVENDYTYHYEKKTQFAGFDFSDMGIKNGKVQSAGIKQEASIKESRTDEQNIVGSDIYAGGNFVTRSSGNTLVLASDISGAAVDMKAEGSLGVLSTDQVKTIETKKSELTNTFTASVGNAGVDLALAVKNAVATIDKCKKILDDPNMDAESKAAASTQMTMSAIFVAQATAKVAGSGATAGFYASVSMTTEGIEEKTKQNEAESVGSLIIARSGAASLKAAEKLTIQGSDIASAGDIMLKGKSVEIISGENKSESSSSREHVKTEVELFNTATGLLGATPTLEADKNTTKSSSTSYTNSRIQAGNGTLKIETKEDAVIRGANIEAKNLDLTGIEGNLIVESQQNQSQGKSEGQGVSIGNSLGYNENSSKSERAWLDNQTTLIGTEGVAIKADHLENTGAVIAQINADGTEGNNMTIDVNSIKVTDIKDSDASRHDSFGISVTIADRDVPTGTGGKTEKEQYASTVGLQMGSGYSDKKQTTEGSIGNGVIKIKGQETVLESQAGDATKTQIITKDEAKETRGIDLTVDTKYLTGKTTYDEDGNIIEKTSGADELLTGLTDVVGMVYTEKNGWGGHTEGAGKELAKESSQLAEDVVDTASKAIKSDQGLKDNGGIVDDFTNKRQLRDAAEAWSMANPELAEQLKNGTGEEQQAAYNSYKQYAAAEFGVMLTDTLSYNGNQVDNTVTVQNDDQTTSQKNMNELAGATDKSTNTALVNEVEQDGSMDKRVDTNAHEMWHQIGNAAGTGSTDAGAERVADQTLDAIVDEIGSGQGPRSNYQNEAAYNQSVGAYGLGNAEANSAEVVQGDMYVLLNTDGYTHISYVIGNEEDGYYYFSKQAKIDGTLDFYKTALGFNIEGHMDMGILSGPIRATDQGFVVNVKDYGGDVTPAGFDRLLVVKTTKYQDRAAIANAGTQMINLSFGEELYNIDKNGNCAASWVTAASAGEQNITRAMMPTDVFENTLKLPNAKEIQNQNVIHTTERSQ